jgi:hypothetical protein
MKTIVAFIVFGLIAIAVIVMIVINVMYRNVKRMREDVEDYFYRRDRRQEQKDRNPFGEDYFKSSRKPGAQGAGSKSRGANASGQQKTARRTTTSGGVTIIDQRQEDKKIFDKTDDEYVEFEEVHG